MVPGAAIGLCVRSIKICPGTTFCRLGMQDAVGVGLQLDEKYHGMPLPFKFKIGVSGCPNNCSESVIKDLGLVGAPKGWRVLAGGFASGLKPRLADLIATDLSDAEALTLSERVLDWFKEKNGKRSAWAGSSTRSAWTHSRRNWACRPHNLATLVGYFLEKRDSTSEHIVGTDPGVRPLWPPDKCRPDKQPG